MIKVALINKSTVVSDEEAANARLGLKAQVAHDLYDTWGIKAGVYFYTKNQIVPPSYWQVVILDDSDQAGALGYHDLTDAGLPISKVFAKTDQQYGLSWTVTASHEILEMLVDPYLQQCTQITNTAFVATEVGDPVEADRYGYLVQGTLVSDFVLPQWFTGTPHAHFDFQGFLTRPLTLLPGGYISIWKNGVWTQKFAEKIPGTTSRSYLSQRVPLRAARQPDILVPNNLDEV